MIFLEIAMILVGLGAIVYSSRIPEVKKEDTDSSLQKEKEREREEAEARQKEKLQEMLDSFTQKAEDVCDRLEEKMGHSSNEKIMGISEHSDQVLEKIEKNHEETVFMYNMMNEKQEELKKLAHDIDLMKAEAHDETAKAYQEIREQRKQFEELKKEIEMDLLAFQQKGQPDADQASIYDAEIARIEAEEARERTLSGPNMFAAGAVQEESARPRAQSAGGQYQPLPEQKEITNHNDEIIFLYKKGHSVKDISRMLSLGQGEVKLVIDLYNASIA